MSTGTEETAPPAVATARDTVCTVRGLVRTYPAGSAARGRGLRRRRTAADQAPETAAAPRPGVVRANDGIDLDVGRGELFGILGPNGAGKTTLVRQLTGLLRPDAGSIDLLGHDLVRHPDRASRLVGYLGQESSALDELTVALAAETTGRLRGLDARAARAERDAVLDELELGPIAGRPIKRLSGGQRRLACFAAVLVGQRPVLVLDEPTTGMDPVARRAVWAAVGRRRTEYGATVLLVTHNVIEAENVLDRVAVLDHGKVIACDTPTGLRSLVADEVRLDLVWRDEPPMSLPAIAALHPLADISGRRWTLRLPQERARAAVAEVTGGPAFAALDDFTLAMPSLEDVYLALGGRGEGLVKS
ncbi:ABC transporter ATP-binding protein [Streptomyces sp. NPDC088197]|uniref:ABC transporter ATP-binding protein n=1 Tax=unclassified Streptomyces TaxID=2593676 RepID=UPI0038047EDC